MFLLYCNLLTSYSTVGLAERLATFGRLYAVARYLHARYSKLANRVHWNYVDIHGN